MPTVYLTDEPVGLGYFEVDHRSTFGDLPKGTVEHAEFNTYTCSHCECVVLCHPDKTQRRERYKCTGCDHHVCDDCAAKVAAGAACYTYRQYVQEALERAIRHPESSLIVLP